MEKPKIGEPCNGCGVCCQIQLCNAGAFLLRKTKYLGEKTIEGQCPALLPRPDGSFVCGLIVKPSVFVKSKYRPEVISRTVAEIVGAGTGCDEIGYDDDPDEANHLDAIVEAYRNNSEWVEKITKAVTLLQRF